MKPSIKRKSNSSGGRGGEGVVPFIRGHISTRVLAEAVIRAVKAVVLVVIV